MIFRVKTCHRFTYFGVCNGKAKNAEIILNEIKDIL